MRARLFLSGVLILSSALPVLGEPQAPAPNGQSMRVVVDGSKNPERIPDHVAIGMFITALATPAVADTITIGALEAKIAPMGLSRHDVAALRGEMAGLYERLAKLREATSQGDLTARRGFVNAQFTLAMDSYTRLLQTLSPEGRAKLTAHMVVVKTKIKAIGPAQ